MLIIPIHSQVTHGLMRLNLDTGKPVVYGVLNVLTVEQAKERAGLSDTPGLENAGIEWAMAAVESSFLAKKYAKM
jgi:6,7-dimethyl-8-ribityllumazine synthase